MPGLREGRVMPPCDVIDAEFFPCGEPAPYATTRDGEPVCLCENHAALAVMDDEMVIGPNGHRVFYHDVDAELFEGWWS